MSEQILIGQISKPQGIKGELKLKLFTDDITRFMELKEIIIDNEKQEILGKRAIAGDVYIYLKGVYDRNKAETLRNKEIYVLKEWLPKLDEDNYYIYEIIGCDVVTENGTKQGTVKDILQYGSADVYVLKTENKDRMFPFLDKVVKEVDIENKKIIVYEDKFNEVVVDED